jgi:hypothetical protein
MLFNKLIKENDQPLNIIKINEQDVEIKYYIPTNQKLEIVTNVLRNLVQNEYSFVNTIQLDVYLMIEIIKNYTNIEFAEDDLDNPAELYDQLNIQGIIDKVINKLPREELDYLIKGTNDTINSYYEQRNSLRGIMEDIVKDYGELDLNAENIQNKLNNSENIDFLKTVVQKMG